MGFIISGIRKKSTLYDTFIEARKRVSRLRDDHPYLIAVLVAIAVFRASGAMDFLIDGIRMGVSAAGLDTQFVEGLPTMLMKPLSRQRGAGYDAGCDETPTARIRSSAASVPSCRDRATRLSTSSPLFSAVSESATTYYTIPCSLLADLAGAIAAVTMTYLFFT